jgi:broad specificity phosphatase PhoE
MDESTNSMSLPPVYFIRHPPPCPIQAPTGLCYGAMDVGIVNDDVAHYVKQLVGNLHTILNNYHHDVGVLPVIQLWSSPLQRCHQLTRALHDALCVQGYPLPPYCVDPRLQEMAFGQWEGLYWDSDHPHGIPRCQINAWANDPLHYAPPSSPCYPSESYAQVIARYQFWRQELMKPVFENMLHMVVTHAGIIRIAQRTAHIMASQDTVCSLSLSADHWLPIATQPIPYAELLVC